MINIFGENLGLPTINKLIKNTSDSISTVPPSTHLYPGSILSPPLSNPRFFLISIFYSPLSLVSLTPRYPFSTSSIIYSLPPMYFHSIPTPYSLYLLSILSILPLLPTSSHYLLSILFSGVHNLSIFKTLTFF